MPDADALIVAIDQGTSSTKVLAVQGPLRVVARGSAPLTQRTPQPGWVEHDGEAVIASVRTAVHDCLAGIDPARVQAIAISNQRESLVMWDRTTGQAVSPVLSWQDRRTIALCDALRAAGHGPRVLQVSGLPLDPMFSAVKASWLVQQVRSTDLAGLCLGTIDSWLMWRLTGAHVIESGNASRTSLVDLATGEWSPELLDIFGIPESVLPRITPSAGILGRVHGLTPLPDGIPVAGILGDSHAALFAHAGWRPGVVKATFGTGSSLMACADGSAPGLCRTIAWRLPGAEPTLALEANILSAGSTLTWLAEVLRSDPGRLAGEAAPDAGGVALIPAFNGLGAPWWDTRAEALLTGMSLGTTREQIARAALDSIPLQVADVVSTFGDAGLHPEVLVADGGMTANTSLMQRQADLAAISVQVARTSELSALGAAQAAGLGMGWWDLAELEALDRDYVRLAPAMNEVERAGLLDVWHAALAKAHSQ